MPSKWLREFHSDAFATTGQQHITFYFFKVERAIIPDSKLPPGMLQTLTSGTCDDSLDEVSTMNYDSNRDESSVFNSNVSCSISSSCYSDTESVIHNLPTYFLIRELPKSSMPAHLESTIRLRWGIRNSSNMCWIISVLQFVFSFPLLCTLRCLNDNPQLVFGVSSASYGLLRVLESITCVKKMSADEVVSNLLRFCGSLQLSFLTLEHVNNHLSVLLKLNGSSMEDTHEFLVVLLDVLRSEESEINRIKPSFSGIDNPLLWTGCRYNFEFHTKYFDALNPDIELVKQRICRKERHSTFDISIDPSDLAQNLSLKECGFVTLDWLYQRAIAKELVSKKVDGVDVNVYKQDTIGSAPPPMLLISLKRYAFPSNVVNRVKVNPFGGVSVKNVNGGKVRYLFNSGVLHIPYSSLKDKTTLNKLPEDTGSSGHFVTLQKWNGGDGNSYVLFDDEYVFLVNHDELQSFCCAFYEGISFFENLVMVCMVREDFDSQLIRHVDLNEHLVIPKANDWLKFHESKISKLVDAQGRLSEEESLYSRLLLCLWFKNEFPVKKEFDGSASDHEQITMSMRTRSRSKVSKVSEKKIRSGPKKSPHLFSSLLFKLCFLQKKSNERSSLSIHSVISLHISELLKNGLSNYAPVLVIGSRDDIKSKFGAEEFLISNKLTVVSPLWVSRCISQNDILHVNRDEFVMKRGAFVGKK